MPLVDVNGARLWVEEEGDGDAVVFIHGGLGDSRLWEPQAHALADRFRTVRYDLRFWGRSTSPGVEFSSVDDLVGALDALGIDRAALVGLSLGGGLGLDVALAHPDRVWALAHVAGGMSGRPLDLGDESAYEEAEKAGDLDAMMAFDFAIWAPLGVDDTIRELWHATPDALGLPEGAAPAPRPAADPAQLTVPTLVVLAKHDPPELRALGEALAEEAPNARLVEVDSDHYLTLREPEQVSELLLEFLSSTAPSLQ
jgi:3-oxoadipate enol-lactonase